MMPLQIQAWLSTPMIVGTDLAPALDNILIWALLDQNGLSVSEPTAETAKRNQDFINANLPIATQLIDGHWYHAASAPIYQWSPAGTSETTKRWDRQDQNLDWGNRRRTWNAQGFSTKSRRNIEQKRAVELITWFALGDKNKASKLLSGVNTLGMRGAGQVSRWNVSEIENDWHLYRNGQLMRPMPVDLVPAQPLPIRNWGWRSPVRLPENKALCYIPQLAVKVNG